MAASDSVVRAVAEVARPTGTGKETEMGKHTVVTYRQANGKPAKTAVNSATLAALKVAGRLIKTHATGQK